MREDICKWYDEEWIYKIYKELIQLNIKKTKQQKNRIKNVQRTEIGIFPTQDIQIAKKHMKKMLNTSNS